MVRRATKISLGLALLGFAAAYFATQPHPGSVQDLENLAGNAVDGQQIFVAAGCAACHLAPGDRRDAPPVLSGGMALVSPFGTFVAPNISPDPDHGIGRWSLAQFSHALRDGVSPDGQHLFPALPWNAYNKMTGQDLANLFAYLQSLPASSEPSKPHDLRFPFNLRRALGGWKLFFENRAWHLAETPTPELARGRYIVEALAHCAECHTPRNALGGLDHRRWMAGAAAPDGKGRVPNITPAALHWSAAEIFAYLTTGFTPDFDSVGGEMAHVVDNMSKLPEADVRAVVAYLKALPAVE